PEIVNVLGIARFAKAAEQRAAQTRQQNHEADKTERKPRLEVAVVRMHRRPLDRSMDTVCFRAKPKRGVTCAEKRALVNLLEHDAPQRNATGERCVAAEESEDAIDIREDKDRRGNCDGE